MRMPVHEEIARPDGAGATERISLDAAARHVLEECRMLLPGIQALFGFQLIVVFSEGFSGELSSAEQGMHLGAILLVTLAIALVMAPAAIHRASLRREVSERFIRVCSRLLLAGMLPLVLGLCLDLYLVARVVAGAPAIAAAIAAVAFAIFALLWLLLPWLERRRQLPPA